METFVHNIGQVLGTSILHSLWQGLLIYGVVRLAFIAVPSASAGKKYKALYLALTAMAVWFGYTFFIEAKGYNWSAQPKQSLALPATADIRDMSVLHLNQMPEQPFYYRYQPLLQTWLPNISAIYLLSVLVNVIRLAMGWQKIRRIKKQAIVATQWQVLTDKLAAQAGIVKNVQIYFSKLVDVPCAIGYVKPVLMLPFTIGTQLTTEEIEVIILHELAHIKSNDYILNLIQQIMALLLFLNPFAQLISKMIDIERENRCDDTVVKIGDPLTYAGALVKLEKTRQQNLQPAMAATGKKYHLFDRVKRIMSDDKQVVNIKHLVFGLLIFISALGSIAWLNPEIENGKLVSKNGAAAVTKLTELVKEVITPVKRQGEPQIPAERNNTIAKTVTVDTVALKAEREKLLAEYDKLDEELWHDLAIMERSPARKEAKEAYSKMVSPKMDVAKQSPQIQQELKLRDSLWRDFYNSEAYKHDKAESDSLYEQLYNKLQAQPEMIAYAKAYQVRRDSVKAQMMQTLGLTETELNKNEDWHEWLSAQSRKEDALRSKLLELPELKAMDEAQVAARRKIYNNPEFDELSKRTMASRGLANVMDDLNNDYRIVYKNAMDKLKKTPEWKILEEKEKKRAEIKKKIDEIQQKLKQ